MFNTVNAKLWIILILLVLMYEKKTFDASLMSADEKDLWNKSFDNTPGGIQSLLAVGQDLPARRHKASCFRANELRPYELNDSIIHVLTHPNQTQASYS